MNTTFRRLGVLGGIGLLLTVLLSAAPPASLSATLKANQWKKRVLLLHGPVGSSKSTIVRLLKNGLQRYSATDAGALLPTSPP